MLCPMQNGEGGDYLLDYSAGRLDATRKSVVEHHLQVCADCAAFVESQRALWTALDDWEQIDISPDFNRRLYRQIDFEELNHSPLAKAVSWARSRWTPLTWKQGVSAAAVCAALLVALLIEVPRSARKEPAPDGIRPRAEKVDLEQVETALEDLEMLSQFKLQAR